MRKVRQKKLKAMFENTFGRKPNGPQFVSKIGGKIGYIPSEWRRLKKASANE